MKRLLSVLLALSSAVAAGTPPAESTNAQQTHILAGLKAEDRSRREQAEAAARRLARSQPAAVDALWEHLDVRGRGALVRALAGSGAREAATLAMARVSDPEPEIFTALLTGLVEGGDSALFTPLPEDVPARRRAHVEALRLRWNVEKELARLKSPSGPTGHYVGQFDHVKQLGTGTHPILLHILTNRSLPFPGEAGAGFYEPVYPGMIRFERDELRLIAANSFGQVTGAEDVDTITKLREIWSTYYDLKEDKYPVERESLAPALAYGLHDLGVEEPVREWIEDLEKRRISRSRFRQRTALWELGYALIRIGEHEKGARCYEDLLADSRRSFNRHVAAYNLACNFSLRSMQEPQRRREHRARALRFLRMAIEFKFVDWPWMEQDRDLDAIRDSGVYKRVLARLKRDYPERRRTKVAKGRDALRAVAPKASD